ncbi:MAG TPA: ABC transporter ATP-binding protein [Erysipelothrix sp.]|jgi:ATP-binding cassette subfamily B protein|nr:ABC transporter ATP-binding protein [Erysipelothrix sp.]
MYEEDFQIEKVNLSLWKRMWSLIMVHRKKLYKSFFVMSIVALIDVLFPVLNRWAIDTFIREQNYDTLGYFIVANVIMIIVQAYTVYLFIYNNGQIEMDLNTDLRQRSMVKLQNQSFSYYDTTNSGWIVTRVTSDIGRLSEVFAWWLVDVIWGLTLMVGVIIVMASINLKMLLWTIIIIPLIGIVSWYFQTRILKNWREVRKKNSQITAAFSEGIMGAKTTKIMGLEILHFKQFDKFTSSMHRKSIKASVLSSIYGPIVTFITSISIALLLADGGNQVLGGVMSAGTLMLFISYANIFFQPIRQIAATLSELQMAQASAERVLSLLDKDIQVVDTPEVIEKYGTILEPKPENYEPLIGKIEFNKVGFYYNPAEIILDDFNLVVEPGQTIALVGETGSGKSTLTNLISRFYEPTKGQILIDDIDYKERSLGWLHSNLGVVLQAPHLFSGTIAENIRFGKLEATEDEIIKVAKMVDAHEFIMQMDKGYESEVGEGGSRLSSGQKQLISFARALIADPSIIILDEATASIDTQTEHRILKAIEVLLKDRTAIVVAHRLSTIVNANRILVIDKGQIVEQGTHQQLLELEGTYFNLYNNQFTRQQENQLLRRL